MNTRNIVKNIRSAEVIQGKPKLPTTGQLSEGEIAVNYAKGYETLSFKNNSNEIVSLSVKTVDDVTVNGKSVVSNKTANITMKGNTTPVADTYTTTTYPSPFNEGAEHISASDNVDTALKKVETNISILASDVITNGTEVSSLKGDVNTIKGSINTITNDVNTIERNVTSIGGKVTNLENDVTNIGSNVSSLEGNVNTLGTQVTNLESYYRNLNNTDINLQEQINSLRGQITTLQGQISSIPTMEFVDLGLPSGTMWAKCNIGATSETDYGDYFMWGSTTPNTASQCTWTNAPFNGGASSYDETYFNSVKNTVCPNGILAKGYDVAYKTTNGAARMPTKAEFDELLNGTTNEWIANYNETGVSGRKFTSKTDTSKYIFIPAAGDYSGGSVDSVGYSSDVWSSSLKDSNLYDAWYLYFSSDNCYVINGNRYVGRSVRAVRNLPL